MSLVILSKNLELKKIWMRYKYFCVNKYKINLENKRLGYFIRNIRKSKFG